MHPANTHAPANYAPRRKLLEVLLISAPVATLQNNYLLRRLLIYGLRSARKGVAERFCANRQKDAVFASQNRGKFSTMQVAFSLRRRKPLKLELLRTWRLRNAVGATQGISRVGVLSFYNYHATRLIAHGTSACIHRLFLTMCALKRKQT